ncbi:hypothetical protein D3C87_1433400 [compost metagenome]
MANSRMGRKALVFIKWQFKHSSIGMAELYAANPLQDASLYGEIYEEIIQSQAEVIASWFSEDEPLAGGAGRKIRHARATAVRNMEDMLKHTAETVTIRSTGHSWCLADHGECVGEGVYEAFRCGDCSAGVIDQTHSAVWQEIHRHNLELSIVTDCGPAVAQRAKREIAMSLRVLTELGVDVP